MATDSSDDSSGSLLRGVVRQFADALSADQRPVVEHYLARLPRELHKPALRELLVNELAWHARRGEQLAHDAYLSRFAEHADLVREVLYDTLPIVTQAQTVAATQPAATNIEPAAKLETIRGIDATMEGTTSPRLSSSGELLLPCRFGDYELLEQLGKGGMGVVYKARQITANRLVALKLIRPDQLSRYLPEERRQVLARFRREVQAAAQLEHDHVVTVYDVGEIDGLSYYAMRLVEGESLRDRLADGPLEPMAAARYCEQVARALAEAHAHGILHRDLKPHNIMLDRKTDRALLADFGLAKLAGGEQQLTATEALMGSPPYMSPEQALDAREVTTASDIYGLGATLYHLVTGRPPFQAADAVSTLVQARTKDPVSPHDLNSAVPRDLDTICLKCLEKNAAKRYASAAEVADRLQRVQRGEAIPERPLGRIEKTRRWCGKNPAVASLVALVVLLLLTGSIASTALALLAEQRAADVRRANKDLSSKSAALTVANGELEVAFEEATRERKRAEQAAVQERAAKEAEAAARERAEAVSQYLSKVFRSPDPQRGGRTITVAEVLRRAANDVETDLKDDAETRSTLLTAIADAYAGLGLYQDELRLRETVHQIKVAMHGPGHSENFEAMHKLAVAYHTTGKPEAAVQVFEELLPLKKGALGEDDASTLNTMNSLAVAYSALGRKSEALAMQESLVQRYRAKFGEDHSGTLGSMGNLAAAYLAAGRTTEAVQLHEEELALKRRKWGAAHPKTLSSMSNLAAAYLAANRIEEGIALHEEALALKRIKLGEEHPHTALSMGNLANAYFKVGKAQEGTSLQIEAARIYKLYLGPGHSSTLQAMRNLAATYQSSGRIDEAISLLEETLTLAKENLGADNSSSIETMKRLAKAYRADARNAAAQALEDEIAVIESSNLSPELAEMLAAVGDVEIAKRLLAQSAGQNAKIAACETWKYAQDESGLAGEFRKDGNSWVEWKNGQAGSRFEEQRRAQTHIDLYDPERKLCVRLAAEQSYFSFDQITWHVLHAGSP